ncbi:MAG: SH3 domain-containing protein, partial [bacterium]|nr:SH3 domain-containing protein [bacterium]
MQKALLITAIVLFFISALTAHSIRVKKVELNLASVTGERAALYTSDYTNSSKEYHTTGETFIVKPYESSRGGDWYCLDTGFLSLNEKYLIAGFTLEVRDLKGVVTARSNVRELPVVSADAVKTISAGDVVTVLSRTQQKEEVEGFPASDYWYEIETATGVTGWIYGALVGLLQPREAVLSAIDALEEGDPDAAVSVIDETLGRFPNGRFYHYSRSFDDSYFDLAPSAEMLLGYAYFLKGDTDSARLHYENAFSYGEEPALTTLKIIDPEADNTYFMKCDYYADTLARVGLGLSWVRADPAKAAGYFARAISDAESGFSTANIVPEYFDAFLIRNLVAMHGS